MQSHPRDQWQIQSKWTISELGQIEFRDADPHDGHGDDQTRQRTRQPDVEQFLAVGLRPSMPITAPIVPMGEMGNGMKKGKLAGIP